MKKKAKFCCQIGEVEKKCGFAYILKSKFVYIGKETQASLAHDLDDKDHENRFTLIKHQGGEGFQDNGMG